ncbi:hypothetical protein D3875_01795 [Deinococcus cavernae]|uniref:Transporter-associated domain-containing protein n=1 Tax=Deinococcus cavernae TaxID=2320857 RepID=A0A418VGQ3_9DEIO|nr:transporter associated domain-containing protein [Deinococcus cavernae]RJF75259.1 hypothetical protein D3875_01795 [Deinococcus cavernae]
MFSGECGYFPGESAITLAGYVLEHLGDFPQVGERLSAEDWTLEVLDLDGARIDKVLIIPPRTVLIPTRRNPEATGPCGVTEAKFGLNRHSGVVSEATGESGQSGFTALAHFKRLSLGFTPYTAPHGA